MRSRVSNNNSKFFNQIFRLLEIIDLYFLLYLRCILYNMHHIHSFHCVITCVFKIDYWIGLWAKLMKRDRLSLINCSVPLSPLFVKERIHIFSLHYTVVLGNKWGINEVNYVRALTRLLFDLVHLSSGNGILNDKRLESWSNPSNYYQKVMGKTIQLLDCHINWWISNLPVSKQEVGTRTRTMVPLEESLLFKSYTSHDRRKSHLISLLKYF